jgi:glutathione S-transferase
MHGGAPDSGAQHGNDGIGAPHVPAAPRYDDSYFGEMEEALSRSPYLTGDSYSLADLAVTPYVGRAEMLAMDGMWRSGPTSQTGIGELATDRALSRASPNILRRPSARASISHAKRHGRRSSACWA